MAITAVTYDIPTTSWYQEL